MNQIGKLDYGLWRFEWERISMRWDYVNNQLNWQILDFEDLSEREEARETEQDNWAEWDSLLLLRRVQVNEGNLGIKGKKYQMRNLN